MTRFSGLCLITWNVPRLVDFYQQKFNVSSEGDDIHSILKIGGLEIAIFSIHQMETMAPGSTGEIGFGNSIIAFEVENVDGEYDRLQKMGVRFILQPTTHPWGARSCWFTDPDGNIVDFFKNP